jgi:hypothetical protein
MTRGNKPKIAEITKKHLLKADISVEYALPKPARVAELADALA